MKELKREKAPEKTWDELSSNLQEFLQEEATLPLQWLNKKLTAICSPNEVEDVMVSIQDCLDNHFLVSRTSNISTLGLYMQEVVQSHQELFFDGLSRLFQHMQLYYQPMPKEDPSIESFREQSQSATFDGFSADYVSFEDQGLLDASFENSENMLSITQPSEIDEFGAEKANLCFPSSLPLISRNPLHTIEMEDPDSFFNHTQDSRSFCSGTEELASAEYSQEEESRNWVDLENDFFPELHSIRIRRNRNIKNGSEKGVLGVRDDGNFHFQNFLVQRQKRDLTRSIDELHRYFDYQMSGRKREGSKAQHLLPLSALAFASLFFDFGNHEEGLEYVKEAIRLAQELSDDKTLVSALYWLFCFLSVELNSTATPTTKTKKRYLEKLQTKGNEVKEETMIELLERCIQRAKKMKMPYWYSLTLLSMNDLLLHVGCMAKGKGGEEQQSSIWKFLENSELMNVNQLADVLQVKYNVLRSCLWDQYNHKNLSSLYSQLAVIRSKKQKGSPSDILSAYCTFAIQKMKEGKYLESFGVLQERSVELFENAKDSSLFLATACSLLSQFAIQRGNISMARHILSDICQEDKQRWEGEIQILVQLEEFPAALHLLQSKVMPLFEKGDKKRSNRFWRDRMENHLKEGKYLAALQQPILALSCALRAFSLCVSNHSHSPMIEIGLVLCECRLQLGDTRKSILDLETLMPTSLQHASALLRYRTCLLLAKAYFIEIEGKKGKKEEERAKKCQELLQQAQAGFLALESLLFLKETYYYQSLLFDYCQDESRRNEAAAQFFRVKEILHRRQTATTNQFSSPNDTTAMAEKLWNTIQRNILKNS